jgi:copper chaperone CopZ
MEAPRELLGQQIPLTNHRGVIRHTKRGRLTVTLMDVTFQYRVPPEEHQMSALGCVREVYGVRQISFNEAKRTVKVEYDISRLAIDDIAALLRGAGLDVRQLIAVN